jgi:hypothetical protein
MKDRSLNILLAAAFGVPGLAVLLLAWLWPQLDGERHVALMIGGAGLLLGASQVLAFFRAAVKADEARVMVEAAAEDGR